MNIYFKRFQKCENQLIQSLNMISRKTITAFCFMNEMQNSLLICESNSVVPKYYYRYTIKYNEPRKLTLESN